MPMLFLALAITVRISDSLTMVTDGILGLLQNFGFTEKEARVYHAALMTGEAPASRIAQAANLKRPTAYLILNQLVERGYVVTQTSSRAELFRACNPMLLLKRHKTMASLLDKAIPELMALSKNYSAEPGVETFYGLEGIEHGWNLCLEAQNDILYFADAHLTASVSSPTPDVQRKIAALEPEEVRYQSEFVKERVRRGIWVRGIIPYYSEADLAANPILAPLQQELIYLKRKGREELREFYFVPHELFAPQVELTTFNDKVLIISYPDTSTCVITSEGLATTLRAVFNLSLMLAKTLEPREISGSTQEKVGNLI